MSATCDPFFHSILSAVGLAIFGSASRAPLVKREHLLCKLLGPSILYLDHNIVAPAIECTVISSLNIECNRFLEDLAALELG